MKHESSMTRTSLLIISVMVIAVIYGGFHLSQHAHAQTSGEQPKYALLIGITNYKGPGLNKIDGCENNVPLLAQTLIDSYGFKKSDVRSLLDAGATKAGIIDTFTTHLIENARKAKQTGKEAVIVYYFCGHGSQYPDQDKDENDGLDETFVAYDSRTGTTPDILDDEIDDLKAELRPLTTNTTLILESCHSGTGSRGDEGDHQFISEEADADKKNYPPFKRKYPPSSDADADTYTEIAASASTNTAKSEAKEYCNCDKPYSLMTKALVQALNRANHNTTYRSLIREVAAVVGERSRQDPRIEGNRDTLLFGGAAKRTKPYIGIERLLPNDQAVIRAGRIHGLKEGSQVAIYASSSATDSGDKDWLTNGVVKEVRNFQSVVQLPPAKEAPSVSKVAVTSHVVLTSPVFGGGPLLVALGSATSSGTSDDAEMFARVRQQLAAYGLISDQLIGILDRKSSIPASHNHRGVVRLRKEKFGVAFPERIRPLARTPKPLGCTVTEGKVTADKAPEMTPETEVYFLDDGDKGGTPLFGRVFLPDQTAPVEIARVIRNYALRINLEGLDNGASTLPQQLSVTINKIPNLEIVENCNAGRLERGLKTKPKATDLQVVKDGRIPVESIFNFKVKNISGELKKRTDPFAAGEPLHITAIYLLNNGDIDVIYPRLGANDPLDDGVERSFGGYIASKPVGAEQLILIVSKKFVDLSFYNSVGSRRNPQSLLERLLKQSGTKSRDSGTLIPDEPDQWGVIKVDLDIVE